MDKFAIGIICSSQANWSLDKRIDTIMIGPEGRFN